METTILKTKAGERRRQRDLQIFDEYNKLRANPENAKTAIADYLAEKYGFASSVSIYSAVRRVRESLQQAAK